MFEIVSIKKINIGTAGWLHEQNISSWVSVELLHEALPKLGRDGPGMRSVEFLAKGNVLWRFQMII